MDHENDVADSNNQLDIDKIVDDEKEPGNLVHMLVSSKHMMLASPVFKAMLHRSSFKEGKELSEKGKVEIPLDDNVEAMTIILNVVHGHNRQVSRRLDLDILCIIAILTDKYQMVEALEAFSEGWIKHLELSMPVRYFTRVDKDHVHKRIGISWVFSKRTEFTKMTSFVQKYCCDDLHKLIGQEGLPIPDIVIGTVRMHYWFKHTANIIRHLETGSGRGACGIIRTSQGLDQEVPRRSCLVHEI